MKKIIYLLVIGFILVKFQANAQSGWTRKANSFYTQAVVSHYSTNNYYTTEGNLSDQGSTFNTNALILYGEYGIIERLTAIIDVPVIMLNSFSSTETVGGIGSIKVGFKYRLFKKLPVALQADFDIPTDDGTKLAKAKTANALGTFDEINLPTSDGEFNLWTTLVASHSFLRGKTYASVYTGVNFRTETFSNQLKVGGEVGHLLFDKLYLIGKLGILEKLTSGSGNQGGSFLYGEGTTFTSYGLTGIYKFPSQLSLVAGYFDYADFLVERRNIYDGGTFYLGLALEF